MRTPHFNIPRVARLHWDGQRSMDRIDILALVLAATLAAAVAVALWAPA